MRIHGTLVSLGLKNRQAGKVAVEAALNSDFATESSLGYVIVDRGTFEKRVEFVNSSGDRWAEGASTESVMFYGFLRRSRRVTREECARSALQFIRQISCEAVAVADVQLGRPTSEAYDQRTFGFETEEYRLGLFG